MKYQEWVFKKNFWSDFHLILYKHATVDLIFSIIFHPDFTQQ